MRCHRYAAYPHPRVKDQSEREQNNTILGFKHVHVGIHKTIWTLLEPLYDGQTWTRSWRTATCSWLWPKMILSSWVFENLIANSRRLLLWIHTSELDPDSRHDYFHNFMSSPPNDNSGIMLVTTHLNVSICLQYLKCSSIFSRPAQQPICTMIFTVWTMIHSWQVWKLSLRRTNLTGNENYIAAVAVIII